VDDFVWLDHCHVIAIVTDPTIRQLAIDLPRRTWSLMNHLHTCQGHVVLTCTNGVSPNHLPVIVCSVRPLTTLSTRAQ